MADYLVTLNDPGSYNVGVDYEVPSKSIQYGNIIIGKTPAQDGTETTFNLNDQGSAYTPNNNQQLIVTKNGLFLDPSNDYNISGDKVVFTTPPAANDDVVIIALAAAADLTRTVNYVIDSGSLPMQPGDKGKLTIDVTGLIENIRVLSDQTGDIVLEIEKCTFADYPNFASITGGSRVQLTNSDKYFDDVLNNWTTTIGAGDILRFTVVSVNNIRRLLISLKLKL
ncbi:hypothetical protein CYVG_00282 [Cyanophage S-SSM6a]|uniref:Structural protein n=1 Tax=Synechococcus phage S-SSM7 TaxID=445686 RepID=E3SL26_9CAUD|nr:virion structural protein [Synechococcus phage S-SSM7]ADO98174.1 structural protein [Synechococcus phage S-SSM7]AGH07725.1 hypothetical protein CYVG_00282 [Cyanophage S-SSM6a]